MERKMRRGSIVEMLVHHRVVPRGESSKMKLS